MTIEVHPQSTGTVLMVRPAHFAYNEETAGDNAFMRPARTLDRDEVERRAREEFDGLVAAIRATGTDVTVVGDTPLPRKPDAVFPNNWFTTHPDGTLVTYPMAAPTRRRERDNPVVDALRERFDIRRHVDLTPAEERGDYLEGTGSLVLDRARRTAYACLSERTDPALARRWAELIDYELELFDASDEQGQPIYHTNVLMAVGTQHAVICLASVAAADRERVRERLTASPLRVVDISFAQVRHFAGNMLELLDGQGLPYWAMSSQAYGALTELQRQVLQETRPIAHAPIEVIEQLGGGSARCMVAEVFLPRLPTP